MEFSFASICEFYTIDEIFKDIKLPNSFDKETLINTIMLKCMQYQPLYVEMPILNQIIKNFFNVNYMNFNKIGYLYDLEYQKDYNPIWNKDGNYVEEESYTKSNTFNSNEYGSDSNTKKEILGSNGSEVNQISAYDSNEFQNNKKITNENQEDNTITDKYTNSKNKNDNGEEKFTHKIERKEQGNIGVTTTAQMLKEEFDVQQDVKYNKYEIIANMFYDELFIHY